MKVNLSVKSLINEAGNVHLTQNEFSRVCENTVNMAQKENLNKYELFDEINQMPKSVAQKIATLKNAIPKEAEAKVEGAIFQLISKNIHILNNPENIQSNGVQLLIKLRSELKRVTRHDECMQNTLKNIKAVIEEKDVKDYWEKFINKTLDKFYGNGDYDEKMYNMGALSKQWKYFQACKPFFENLCNPDKLSEFVSYFIKK